MPGLAGRGRFAPVLLRAFPCPAAGGLHPLPPRPCGCAQTSNPRSIVPPEIKCIQCIPAQHSPQRVMQTFLLPHLLHPSNQALLKILSWETLKVVTPPLHLRRTCSLSRDVSCRNEKCPCLTLEVCLHDLRSHMLFFEEGQSLITSSTSLPHNTHTRTHTHFLIARAAPVIADPLSGMACANQRNVLLPLEKDSFHNHVLRMFLRESVSDCPHVQASLSEYFADRHLLCTLSNH